MWARGGCFKTGMEISIATGSLVFFHLTSSHEEIHDCPMELDWKRELRVFGNQQQISMAAQKQKHTQTHKYNKIIPHVKSQIKQMLTWQVFWAHLMWVEDDPECKMIILFLFLYLLPTVEMSNLEWQASERYSKVETDFFRQSKRSSVTTISLSIGLLTYDDVFSLLHRAWSAIFFPFLPLSCLKIHGCTNFCIAFDFFKILMKKSNWKKVSYIMN